jgi:hypothetical protein
MDDVHFIVNNHRFPVEKPPVNSLESSLFDTRTESSPLGAAAVKVIFFTSLIP